MNKELRSKPYNEIINHFATAGSSFLVAYYYLLKKSGASPVENKQVYELLEESCRVNKNKQEVNYEAPITEALNSLKTLEQYLFENNIISYLPNSIRRELALILRETSSNDGQNGSNIVKFYDVDQPFGELSNFSDHPVYFDKLIWKTVEHYYQASKFNNKIIKEKIRQAESPVVAKDISQYYSLEIVPDWGFNKIAVMDKSVTGKFNQHPELQKVLISTGDKNIIELSPDDLFWGDPGDGSGENNLGKILMKLREELN